MKFLTLTQAAAELKTLFGGDRGFSRPNLTEMCQRGELPAVKVRGKWHVSADLESWLRDRMTQETAERQRRRAQLQQALTPPAPPPGRVSNLTRRYGRPS